MKKNDEFGPMTIEEFIDKFYRPERLALEPGRRERIIKDRTRDVLAQGVAIISSHDCIYRRIAKFCATGHVKLF